MQGLVGNGDQLFNDGGNRAPGGENRVEASKTYLIWTWKIHVENSATLLTKVD
jgi:hypothetical protein